MNEREIFTLLQEACVHIRRENYRDYQRCMDEAKAAIDELPKHRTLQGEWLMASSLACPGDLDRLCALYREAKELIGGRSRLFPPDAPLFDYYCAFSVCNARPGCADENAQKLAEAVRLFHSLTGGGLGTDVCYRAQLAHYRGRLADARSLAIEAFGLAKRRGLVALWAAYILADIAKHETDGRLWRFAYGYIRAVSDGSCVSDRSCQKQAGMLSCMLDMSLGLLHSVPAWVKDGDFSIIPAPWGYQLVGDRILRGTTILALMTQLEYEAYSGQTTKALNLADMIQKVYGLGNVELDAYLNFFRAGCYFVLGDAVRVQETVRQAVGTVAPDGLWLIAAEFVPSNYGAQLLEAARETDKAGAARMLEIGAGFWSKLELFREELLREAPTGLTKREQEIAGLLTQGRSNSEIAAALGISERTVKGHLTNIYSKYNVSRRTQVAEAMEQSPKIKLASWIS